AGLYAALFDTEHRYTGASLGYQIAGIGAGISHVLFAAIMSANGGTMTIPLSLVLTLVAAVSILCILRLGETKSRSLSEPLSGSAATAVDPTTTTPTAEGQDS